MRSRRVGWAAALVASLVGAGLVLMPPTAATGDPGDIAELRLRSDADGRVTLRHAPTGGLSFVGTASGVLIENPVVDRHYSVRRAADAHMARYGAALGASGASTFGDPATGRTVSGVDTVRYQQQVDGVPVLGGEVVLGLGSRRELRSLAADVTGTTTPVTATVSAEAAVATARGLVARSHPDADLEAVDHGRWILDPVVAGLDLPGGVRTVRRVEVTDAAGVRELVLVDDRSGRLAFRVDLIQHIDRVVCDRVNVRGPESTCTSGFARTEASGPSAVVDVEDAFDFSGETSDFYASAGGIDLTDLLGVDVGGQPKLASTVRFCPQDLAEGCPYSNAFWNGTQMFYGADFAAADDVVGHEMTHGFVDQYSQLF